MKFDLLSGGCIRRLPGVADHDFVALGEDVFDGDVKVGPSTVRGLHHRFGRLRSDRDAAGLIVIEKILAKVFQGHLGFLPVHEILEMILDKSFHVFEAKSGIGLGRDDGSLISHGGSFTLRSSDNAKLNDRIFLSSRHFFNTKAWP